MSEKIEFTASTVEEALKNAALKLNKKSDEIKYEVVQDAKQGFLGIGKKDAIISVLIDDSASEKLESKKTETVLNDIKEEETQLKESSEYKEENDDEVSLKSSLEKSSEEKSVINEELQEEFSERVSYVKTYLEDIIRKMGIEDISVDINKEEGGALLILNCAAESKGNIIGKRGETLDALQYLASVVVNRDKENYYRITLDSNGYREKRTKTLQSLALKIAKNVARSGRNNTLEPMNPYERRIIHSVIADFEGVSSHSVGEEPYRKVVITSDNPRPRYKKNYHSDGKYYKGKGKNGSGNQKGSRRYKDDKDYVPKRKSLDSMKSSFEKEYSKPKPEDSIDSGLYGKIEF